MTMDLKIKKIKKLKSMRISAYVGMMEKNKKYMSTKTNSNDKDDNWIFGV